MKYPKSKIHQKSKSFECAQKSKTFLTFEYVRNHRFQTKSQISLFAIFGIVILIVFAIFFSMEKAKITQSFNDKTSLSNVALKKDMLKLSIDLCVEKLYYKAIEIYGFGKSDDVASYIDQSISACIGWDAIREQYPEIEVDEQSRKVIVTEEENSNNVDLTYYIKYETPEQKFEIDRFNYTFSKITFVRVDTDENGVIQQDTYLMSGDNTLEVFLPKDTKITDESFSPVVSPMVQMTVQSNDLKEIKAGVITNFIYKLEPDGIKFDKPIRLTANVPSIVAPKIYPNLNFVYKTEGGIWAAVPSYYDGYTNSLIGETTHFSFYSMNDQANVLVSYGLGWVFHDVLDLNPVCNDIKWEEYNESTTKVEFTGVTKDECGPLRKLILLPGGMAPPTIAKGFTKEGEAQDYKEGIDVLVSCKEILVGIPPVREIEKYTIKRNGYLKYEDVGEQADSESLKATIKTNILGSYNPNALASATIKATGAKLEEDLIYVNEKALYMKASEEQEDKSYTYKTIEGQNVVAATDYSLSFRILKDGLANGCSRAAMKFEVRGKIIPCSIQNRFNYLGGEQATESKNEELSFLRNLIEYLTADAAKEDYDFEYFNLPIDQIKEDRYKGLPAEFYASAETFYSDPENIMCCGDEEYYDQGITEDNPDGCASIANILNCAYLDSGANQPCNCGGFVLQDNSFQCNVNYPSIVQCPVCTLDKHNSNECPPIEQLPCICGTSNEVISLGENKDCVEIEII